MSQPLRRHWTHFSAPTIAIAWRTRYLAADQQVTFLAATVYTIAWSPRPEYTSSWASLRWEMGIACSLWSTRFIKKKTDHSRGSEDHNHTAHSPTVEVVCTASACISMFMWLCSCFQSKLDLGYVLCLFWEDINKCLFATNMVSETD